MICSVILKVSSDRLTEYLYRKDVSLSMRDLMLVLKNSVRSVVARVGVEVNGIMTKTLRRALSARTSLRLALFRFDISSFWHICTPPAYRVHSKLQKPPTAQGLTGRRGGCRD